MSSFYLPTYKGYTAVVHQCGDGRTWYGVLQVPNDLVDLISDTKDNIETEFHKAVDDYIAFCNDLGVEPEKTRQAN